MKFDFAALRRPEGFRRTYVNTIEAFRKGLLSHGFMWEVAKNDELFAALLRKEGIEKP